MGRKQLQFLILLAIIAQLTIPSYAWNATDYWEQGNTVTYLVSFSIKYNHDLTYYGQQIYPENEYPDKSFTNIRVDFKYDRFTLGKMRFVISSDNPEFVDVFFEGNSEDILVDPTNGFPENKTDCAFIACNTQDFKEFGTTHLKVDYGLNDPEYKYFQVDGKPTMNNYTVNGEDVELEIWNLVIPSFETFYRDLEIGLDFKLKVENVYRSMTVDAGITTYFYEKWKFLLKDVDQTEYFDAISLFQEWKILELNVPNAINTTTDDLPTNATDNIDSNTQNNLVSVNYLWTIIAVLMIIPKRKLK